MRKEKEMEKWKEIKFRRTRWNWEGRQGGVIYGIYEERAMTRTCAPLHSVSVYNTLTGERVIDTAGHRLFHMDDAKEFCQQIAAGEIDLEAMRAEFAAEDVAREQAAIQAATRDAKKVHARLDAVGLKYLDLLELEAVRHDLGEIAHNILLGYERGEGWPEC